jgi:hypothetical protein
VTVELTPNELQFLLEWAGARLVAIPGPRVGPNGTKVIWPEYSQDQFEVLKFRGEQAIRAGAPSKDEIPIMDEILLLPSFCRRVVVRRTVRLRTLVHPVNNRHLFPWRKIAAILKSDSKTVRNWFSLGLNEIIERAPCSTIDSLVMKMGNHIPTKF